VLRNKDGTSKLAKLIIRDPNPLGPSFVPPKISKELSPQLSLKRRKLI